jgi:hypothetical protein
MGGVCPNPDTKVHALLFDADSSTYRGASGSESTDDSGNTSSALASHIGPPVGPGSRMADPRVSDQSCWRCCAA